MAERSLVTSAPGPPTAKVEPVCPACRRELRADGSEFVCQGCGARYPVESGAVNFLDARQDEGKERQRAIYEGRAAAFINLHYDDDLEHRRRLQDLFTCLDERRLAALTMRDAMNAAMFRRCRFAPGQDVLDIGSGNGFLLNTLARLYGIRGVGIDLSSLAVRRCLEWNPHGLSFHVADAERLPFADGSFDRVVSFDVLEHVERQKVFLAEAARVLRPGGRMLLYAVSRADDYTFHWLQRRKTAGRVGVDGHGGHRRDLFLSPDEATAWLGDLPLVDVALVPFHAFFTIVIDERLGRYLAAAARNRTAFGTLFRLAVWADLPFTKAGLGNGFYILAARR